MRTQGAAPGPGETGAVGPGLTWPWVAAVRGAALARRIPHPVVGPRRARRVTLAAIAIPECLGYGAIAQVPVVAGLYTIILPTIVFVLIGSSRLMVVGADSATAALLSSGIAGLGVAGLRAGSDEWLQGRV